MKNLFNCLSIALVTYIAISCSNTSVKELDLLNGYWEIEKVITSEGIEKQYDFSQSIDFFEVNEMKGIRKKVQPRFDGHFITTKNSELFELSIEHDSLRMRYKTPLSTWKETLISAKENQMIIKNEVGNLYFYKPYTKIEL